MLVQISSCCWLNCCENVWRRSVESIFLVFKTTLLAFPICLFFISLNTNYSQSTASSSVVFCRCAVVVDKGKIICSDEQFPGLVRRWKWYLCCVEREAYVFQAGFCCEAMAFRKLAVSIREFKQIVFVTSATRSSVICTSNPKNTPQQCGILQIKEIL